MGELAEASGVSAATIKHYLREGLLPEPVKTSRNMAYYPPEFVDRIRLIKQLQEERFMPLKVIRSVLEEDPDRARTLVELEDRILERALAGERTRTSAAEVRERYDVPAEVLDRLEEIEVLSPNSRGYTPSDVGSSRRSAASAPGAIEQAIGFTVYDTLRYKRAMEELVREEVEVLMDRVAGKDGARPRDGADRGRSRAAQGPDRGDAHQVADRRAGAPARGRSGRPSPADRSAAAARATSRISDASRAPSERPLGHGDDLQHHLVAVDLLEPDVGRIAQSAPGPVR